MKKTITRMMLALLAVNLTFAQVAWAADSRDGEAESQAVTETREIDMDLTSLSITMMFAETTNILSHPEPNLGKIIRLAGMYYSIEDPDTGELQYYCSVYDGCCSTADVRFSLEEGAEAPETYLKKGDVILLTGEFAPFEGNSLNPHGLIHATLS